MSIRDPATITNVGRQMMTAGGDITYTKAVLYGQDISHLTKEQLEGLTSIGDPLITVPVGISDKSNNGNGTTVVIEATFQNSNLKADLPYTAIAFFAKKGEDAEKLIAVGVATDGSYLAAASPDGVATDALDVKLAIAIGDASNVTTVIDPAGSVTPATLNAAISKVTHDLTAKIDVKADQDDTEKSLATKADKTTVESDLATKADQSSLDETNAEVAKKADSEDVTKQLATKANASDVADNVKTLQANIDTKADKATVDAEISKIDFTPYAKSADVAKDLQGYTTTADLTKLLAGKRDIADSYSRDELDKKFLQLSTDTSGKVSADQIAKLLASKVDKTDLTSQLQAITDSIGTKANSANVTAELAKKDDTSDVDAKIKVVTDLTNTKANANDVYNRSSVDNAFTEVRGRLSKLEGTQTLDSPDFNGITASGVYYITNNNGANIKNNPVDQWGVLIVSNGNGHRVSQVYYPDDGNPPWYRSLDESTWRSWYQLSTRYDVNNAVSLANKAQDTANQANTNISKIDLSPYAKSADVNSELANKASTTDVSNGLAGKTDKSQVNVDGDLFSAPGSITSWACLQADGSKNVLRSVRTEGQPTAFNTGNFDAGILFGGNDTKAFISVGYEGNTARVSGGNNTGVWHEDIAWKSDVTNLQNQVNTKASASDVNSLNQTISALQQTVQSLQNTVNQQATTITGLQTQVSNQANEISYIKANYIEGKRFAKADESQATAWEKENSQRIAFITDN